MNFIKNLFNCNVNAQLLEVAESRIVKLSADFDRVHGDKQELEKMYNSLLENEKISNAEHAAVVSKLNERVNDLEKDYLKSNDSIVSLNLLLEQEKAKNAAIAEEDDALTGTVESLKEENSYLIKENKSLLNELKKFKQLVNASYKSANGSTEVLTTASAPKPKKPGKIKAVKPVTAKTTPEAVVSESKEQ